MPVLFILLTGIGCSYECGPAEGLKPAFIGYQAQQIQSFIIKKYPRGGAFNLPADSVVVDTSVARFCFRGDTAEMCILSSVALLLPGFDYRVTIPSLNKTFEITDLKESDFRIKQSLFNNTKPYCLNKIESGRINGVFINFPDFSNNIYFKK